MVDLKAIQLKMPAFFEMTPDLVCIAGKDGFFKQVNKAVIDKLGYTEEELFAAPIASFVHPEDRDLTSSERSDLLNGKVLINFENRYVTKQGKDIWLAWTSIYFPDDRIVFAIAKDVTQRKHIEADVEKTYAKFKSLATHFKNSIEKDRKYLAVELHEELAQLASVIKMDVDWLRIKTPDLPEAAKSRIEHASVVADLLINTIRRITFSISPVMLEETGLNATLTWHCKEFSVLNGIPCYFESDYDEADLSLEIKIDFFRICQEALSNIMYHAEAKNVMVSIKEADGQICLSIVDDGHGFTADQQLQTPGLISMRERAHSINGKLSIDSQPGKGTTISVILAKPS
ncbi:MAG: PAS domain-containing sensor histidine kinase [Bacteroidota bacterium]